MFNDNARAAKPASGLRATVYIWSNTADEGKLQVLDKRILKEDLKVWELEALAYRFLNANLAALPAKLQDMCQESLELGSTTMATNVVLELEKLIHVIDKDNDFANFKRVLRDIMVLRMTNGKNIPVSDFKTLIEETMGCISIDLRSQLLLSHYKLFEGHWRGRGRPRRKDRSGNHLRCARSPLYIVRIQGTQCLSLTRCADESASR